MAINFIITNDGTISAIIGGKPYSISADNSNYDKAKEALRAGDAESFVVYTNVAEGLNSYSNGNVTVSQEGKVLFKNKEIHSVIATRIVALMRENLPFEPMVRFLDNLMQNPSFRSVEMLYDFLEHKYLPITEDGCFLGYKRVREDWLDFYSSSVDNSIGSKIPPMERNQVDDDPQESCSNGYHVGSIQYVRTFHAGEGHVVIVKVNPKDVVAVPKGETEKVRVTQYEVLYEVMPEFQLESPVYTSQGSKYEPPVVNVERDEDYDEDEDYEDDDYDYDEEDDDYDYDHSGF